MVKFVALFFIGLQKFIISIEYNINRNRKFFVKLKILIKNPYIPMLVFWHLSNSVHWNFLLTSLQGIHKVTTFKYILLELNYIKECLGKCNKNRHTYSSFHEELIKQQQQQKQNTIFGISKYNQIDLLVLKNPPYKTVSFTSLVKVIVLTSSNVNQIQRRGWNSVFFLFFFLFLILTIFNCNTEHKGCKI